MQDPSGNVFDAIVFGEQAPQHWLAGSNFFQRTQALQGETETAAHESFVHIAMAYHEDGTIRAFRNGEPYGQAYRSNGPVLFKSGNAQLLLGNRHGSPGGGRLLQGAISKVRFYDRALSEDDVRASYQGTPHAPSLKQLLAAMSPDERNRHQTLTRHQGTSRQLLEELESKQGMSSPWADLAHALFNLKEFIYVQ